MIFCRLNGFSRCFNAFKEFTMTNGKSRSERKVEKCSKNLEKSNPEDFFGIYMEFCNYLQ